MSSVDEEQDKKPDKMSLSHLLIEPSPLAEHAAAEPVIPTRVTRAGKRPWTDEEDRSLRRLVEQLGHGLWAAIAAQIPGRSGKQVRERWLNHLSPHVTKRPWSEEEDRLILDSHRQIGNSWSRIARLLQGRSDNSVKNRFYTTLRRRVSGGIGKRRKRVWE